jgi:N4-gp56 family major capsid protein
MPTNVYGNGTTTATAGANTITHYYDRAGIKAANAVNVFQQFADRKYMPQKYGKTYKISKFLHIYDRERTNSWATSSSDFKTKGYLTKRDLDAYNTELANNVLLSEGAQDVNKRSIKKVTFETSLARYGEMIDYTDEVELFSEDYIQVRYREELGALANQRFEDLIQRDMLSTTNRMYAGAASSQGDLGAGNNVDGDHDDDWKVSYNLIRKASKLLFRNRAKKVTDVVTGSTKIDTKTVNSAYYTICGPEVKYDLETITRGDSLAGEFAFVPAFKYASASNLAEGEFGQMHDVRFILAESMFAELGKGAEVPDNYAGSLSYTGTNTGADGERGHFDVFPILFPTKGSFATVGLKGKGKIKFGSKSPSELELKNPYGTQGFFSYNFWYAGIILDDATLLKIDVLASA